MVGRTVLAAAIASALLAGAARAEGPAGEALREVGVATKDGATYRGELVERVPGDHVTIKLASGETKRFAWADVVEVATSKDERPTVHLVVDGDRGAVLERRASTNEGWQISGPPSYVFLETWEPACVVPCRTTVDAMSTFRVNGDGIATSPDFTLPPGRDPLALHVATHSQIAHVTGIALTLTGAFLLVVAAASFVAAPSITDSTQEKNLRGLGYVSVGAGALLFGAGLPAWILTYSRARTDDGAAL